MRLWETFRFEVAYQSRRVSTWLYFVLLLGVSFLMAREVFVNEAQEGSYFLNAPFAVAQVTLVECILSLLPLAALAGGAAARDVETRMHPLLYTAPVGKAAYLGGRFLAAFALGALMMAAIPAGLLAAALLPGEHADLIGPIRPAAYASAYFLLALPNGRTGAPRARRFLPMTTPWRSWTLPGWGRSCSRPSWARTRGRSPWRPARCAGRERGTGAATSTTPPTRPWRA
jgi:hypothetical protein